MLVKTFVFNVVRFFSFKAYCFSFSCGYFIFCFLNLLPQWRRLNWRTPGRLNRNTRKEGVRAEWVGRGDIGWRQLHRKTVNQVKQQTPRRGPRAGPPPLSIYKYALRNSANLLNWDIRCCNVRHTIHCLWYHLYQNWCLLFVTISYFMHVSDYDQIPLTYFICLCLLIKELWLGITWWVFLFACIVS